MDSNSEVEAVCSTATTEQVEFKIVVKKLNARNKLQKKRKKQDKYFEARSVGKIVCA